MKEGNKLNLAMVGCGDVAGTYLAAIPKTDRCRLAQVMDVNLALAEERGRENRAPATARYEDVLANPDVDAVILSVPHFLHAPMTLQAFEAGKHVLCDKPIATNIADGQRMIDAARRTGRTFTVNYALRCSDRVRLARKLVRDGWLGDILALTIVTVGMKPEDYWAGGWSKVTKTDWRRSKAKSGGGVMLMNASHYMDLLFHVTGQSAVGVTGMASTLNSPPGVEVEDLAVGALRLRNGGILSAIASSCYAGGLSHHMSILGRKGQIELHGGEETPLRVFLVEAGTSGLEAHKWLELPVPRSGRPNGYSEHLDGFAAAVFDDSPVPVDPRDALHTLACVLGIYGEQGGLPPGYDDAA